MEKDNKLSGHGEQPNDCSVFAVFSASTMPVNRPVRTTIGREPTPIEIGLLIVSAI